MFWGYRMRYCEYELISVYVRCSTKAPCHEYIYRVRSSSELRGLPSLDADVYCILLVLSGSCTCVYIYIYIYIYVYIYICT